MSYTATRLQDCGAGSSWNGTGLAAFGEFGACWGGLGWLETVWEEGLSALLNLPCHTVNLVNLSDEQTGGVQEGWSWLGGFGTGKKTGIVVLPATSCVAGGWAGECFGSWRACMHAAGCSGAQPAERGGHPGDPERDDGHRWSAVASWTARPPREVVSNLRSGGSGYRPGGMDDTQPALPEFLRQTGAWWCGTPL